MDILKELERATVFAFMEMEDGGEITLQNRNDMSPEARDTAWKELDDGFEKAFEKASAKVMEKYPAVESMVRDLEVKRKVKTEFIDSQVRNTYPVEYFRCRDVLGETDAYFLMTCVGQIRKLDDRELVAYFRGYLSGGTE